MVAFNFETESLAGAGKNLYSLIGAVEGAIVDACNDVSFMELDPFPKRRGSNVVDELTVYPSGRNHIGVKFCGIEVGRCKAGARRPV